MASIHANLLSRAIASLARVYRFQHPSEVATFLQKHPNLVPLLEEARPIIARLFGPETPVSVDVVYDPEGDEDDCRLFAFIEIARPVAEAMPLLDRFRDVWWIAASWDARRLLEFSLRYVYGQV